MFDNLDELEVFLANHSIGAQFDIKLTDRVVTCRVERITGIEPEATVEEEEVVDE